MTDACCDDARYGQLKLPGVFVDLLLNDKNKIVLLFYNLVLIAICIWSLLMKEIVARFFKLYKLDFIVYVFRLNVLNCILVSKEQS